MWPTRWWSTCLGLAVGASFCSQSDGGLRFFCVLVERTFCRNYMVVYAPAFDRFSAFLTPSCPQPDGGLRCLRVRAFVGMLGDVARPTRW